MRQRTHDRRQLHRRTHRLEPLRRHGMRRDILAQAPLQYEWLLAHTYNMRTIRGTRANVDAIDQHAARNRVVQPRHNGRDGALARATRAHQVRHALQLHRHVAQHTHIRPRGIRHAHSLQRNASLHRRQRLRSRRHPARPHAAEPEPLQSRRRSDATLERRQALQNRLELAHRNEARKKRTEHVGRVGLAAAHQHRAVPKALEKGQETHRRTQPQSHTQHQRPARMPSTVHGRTGREGVHLCPLPRIRLDELNRRQALFHQRR